MDFQDKSFTCIDCGFTFIFTAIDQQYYRSRGYLLNPQRCASCKEARQTKAKHSPAFKRDVITITCVRCGRDTSIPENSHTVSPIYCSDCSMETGAPVILDRDKETD